MKKSPLSPMKPLPSPYISPQPMTRNAMVATANTTKFLEMMLTVFLARAKPDSTSANPRFMKNTSIAASNTHTVSMTTFMSMKPLLLC
jgi:hypothetical protein